MEKKPPKDESSEESARLSVPKASESSLFDSLRPETDEDDEEKKPESKRGSKEKKSIKRVAKKFGDIFASLVSLGGERRDAKKANRFEEKVPLIEEEEEEFLPRRISSEDTEKAQQTPEVEETRALTEHKLPEEIAGHSRPEHISQIVKRVEKDSAGAMQAAERLNKKRELRTRRHIRKLKKEAKTAKREREEIKRQQEEFEKQLDKNIKEAKKTPQPSETAQLVVLPEQKTAPGEEAIAKELPSPENGPVKLTREQIEKLVYPERQAKPQDVLEKVAEAAEQNVPLESLYERRHELKDDTARQQIAKLADAAKRQPLKGGFGPRYSSADLSLESPHPESRSAPTSGAKKLSNDPTMYKQAVISGFVTAVVLLAVIIALIVFS